MTPEYVVLASTRYLITQTENQISFVDNNPSKGYVSERIVFAKIDDIWWLRIDSSSGFVAAERVALAYRHVQQWHGGNLQEPESSDA